MRYVRISQDVWINLEEVESIVRNENGTALLQGRARVYESTVPIEAILSQTQEERIEERVQVQQASVSSPLIAETRPAW